MQLTFVRWYTQTAVYLDGQLVTYGAERPDEAWHLLQALGYTCVQGEDIPTHRLPPEYDRRQANSWWQPPESLAVLEQQRRAVRERERQERIASLRKELSRLLEEKP